MTCIVLVLDYIRLAFGLDTVLVKLLLTGP